MNARVVALCASFLFALSIGCDGGPPAAGVGGASSDPEPPVVPEVRVTRLPGNPIVRPHMDDRMGHNVQGPSLIRVPDWLPDPLGRYYLYFADHKGDYIRLAYADELTGPWQIHSPGSLQLAESHFATEPASIPDDIDAADVRWAKAVRDGVPIPIDSATKPHIASPDVHVRDDRQEIVMYYHGLEGFRFQRSRVATSTDGIHFEAREPLIARSYLRAFEHDGQWYAMAMPGIFYRSADGIADWLPGSIDGTVGVELDPTLDRHEIRRTASGGWRASGYPRPVSGVDPERNLRGISFAAANVSGLLARFLECEHKEN